MLALTFLCVAPSVFTNSFTNSFDSTYSQSKDYPQDKGNWIIDTNVTVTNQTIVMDGDLIVTGTGGLTLEGVAIIVNNSFDGQYMIEVQNGGYLNVTKGSIITSADPNYEFMFWVQPGSHFVMRDSVLHEAGWDSLNQGLVVASPNSIVENNIISDNYYGVYLRFPSTNSVIGNNTIFRNHEGVVLYLDMPSNGNLIYGNEIANNAGGFNEGRGIRIDYSFENVIEKNIIHSNSDVGIFSSSSPGWNIIGNNTIYNNHMGMEVRGNTQLVIGNNVSTNVRQGIRVYGTTCTLTGNQMWNNGVGDGYRTYYNLYVHGTDLETYNHTIDTTNTVNGKPVFYFWNVHDQVFENLDGGHITFVYSTNVTLRGSTVIHGDSVLVMKSSNITVVDGNFSNNFYGVHLRNSAYNTVARNQIYGNFAGVHFFNNYNTIRENTVVGNNVGIVLVGSSRYNVVANNTVKLNRYSGIIFQNDPFYNTVSDNLVESNGDYGIYFKETFRNTMRGNTIVASGSINLFVNTDKDVIEYFNHSIDTSNLVNGVPVRYYYGISDQVIENMNLTHLTVAGSSNVTVRNVNVSNGDPGYFAYTSGAKIESSEFSDGYYGMYLYLHSTVFFENCSIRDTRHLDFRIHKDVDATSLNSTFKRDSLEILSADSELVVKNYLHVEVRDSLLDPLQSVQVNASDNGFLVYQGFTDINGEDRWIPITDGVYYYLSSKPRYRWQENITTAEVFFPGKDFDNPPDYPNPRDVNMSASHWEFFYEKGAMLPDYVPRNATPSSPQNVLPGSSNTISTQVMNVGQNAATISSVLAFYNETDVGNPFQSYVIGALSSGETSSYYQAIWKAPVTHGTYNVTIEVDYDDDILESNETNNTYFVQFIVISSPPPPTNLTTEILGNTNIMLEWDPPNSSFLDHYLIYRHTDQREFDFSNPAYNTSSDPNPLRTNWTDTGAAGPGSPQEYYYVVRTVSIGGQTSTTSNTAGKWTKSFRGGRDAFSLPLEPFANWNVSWYSENIPGTEFIRWMNTTGHWVNHYPTMGEGVNDIPAIMGDSFEISLSSPINFTFCGYPASMIRFHEGMGDSIAFRKSLSAQVEGNDINLSWESVTGAVGYLVFRSDKRNGLHDLSLSPIANTTDTHWIDSGVIGSGRSEYYYMVIPIDPFGEPGSGTYSVGVFTEEYQSGTDAFALPLKPLESHSLDWYCDNIPNVVGIAHLMKGYWRLHAREMPEGVYDAEALQAEGHQISIDGAITTYTFVGY